jgi:hypothetical protein
MQQQPSPTGILDCQCNPYKGQCYGSACSMWGFTNMTCTLSTDCDVPEANYSGLILPITDPYSPTTYNTEMTYDEIMLPFDGESIYSLYMFMDGDLYLTDENNNYHMRAFHYLNSVGFFCFRIVTDKMTLHIISSAIRKASFNNSEYTQFNATNVYVITWIIRKDLKYTFYQVSLCTDGRSAFMIINYKLLQVPSDSSEFLIDSNNNQIYFNGSTSGSNCGVPGQFVYQLSCNKCFNIQKIYFFIELPMSFGWWWFHFFFISFLSFLSWYHFFFLMDPIKIFSGLFCFVSWIL